MCDENTVADNEKFLRKPGHLSRRQFSALTAGAAMAMLLPRSAHALDVSERDDEIQTAMDDLRGHGVDILTLGQYLRPSANHLPVERWVHPDDFARYRAWGLERGFIEVASGPLVRSSYRADRILERNNLGLDQDREIPLRNL